MNEKWEDIVIDGYDIRYQISNYGRVKSLARYSEQGRWLNESIMKTYNNRKGYLYVDLYVGNRKAPKVRRYIHRLVAEYFIPNPDSLPEVDHIDTNPSNNIYTNLRWCTHKDNYKNETTKQNQKEAHKNDRPTAEAIAKMSKKISVYKDGEYIHTFSSYKDLDQNSKNIFGETLWNVYVRQVINGLREDYKGYTFKLV